MPRHVFYSFHYENDFWRTWQVRQMGALSGQRVAHANEWENIRRSQEGIKRWIDAEMRGKTCVVVLIGAQTATRQWVNYEICKGWDDGKGIVGVHIGSLKGEDGQPSMLGPNPFSSIFLKNGHPLSDYVPAYNPIGWESRQVYASIERNIVDWIDHAIEMRRSLNSFA